MVGPGSVVNGCVYSRYMVECIICLYGYKVCGYRVVFVEGSFMKVILSVCLISALILIDKYVCMENNAFKLKMKLKWIEKM